MFKRGKKLAALLVTAASVISMVPTTVSAASYTKMSDIDGIIYNAVAYKDGKFYIDGEPKGKDESVYYLDNGTYKTIKDIDNEDEVNIYGSKYLDIESGEYYFDLSTGKLSEDDIQEENLDSASEKLRREVKSDNDGRFDATEAKNYKELKAIPGNKFSELYYKTEYKVKDKKTSVNGSAETLTVYTGADGKYIDADYNLGTIRVKLDNNKSAKISNTSDSDSDVRISVSNTKEIGQDSSNIYRIAELCVDSVVAGSPVTEINGIEVEDNSDYFKISEDGKKVTLEVIQIISKAQASKKIDGIKYAKTVENYFLCDQDGDKTDLLSKGIYSIIDSKKFVSYEADGDTVYTQTVELKSKGSKYYVEIEDTDEIELNDDESFDVDVKGNLWAISDDYIYKFDNKSQWKKVYKVNDEFISLSVYDDNNLIAWNDDEEVYSIIAPKSSSNNTNTSNTTDSNTTNNSTTNNTNNGTNTNTNSTNTSIIGWNLGNDGKWCYYRENGIKATGWIKDGVTWYYLNESGVMVTGWLYSNGTWYYLKESGAMATGWINDGGTWYYLNSAGAMLSNTTVDGYKLGANGAWIKGAM